MEKMFTYSIACPNSKQPDRTILRFNPNPKIELMKPIFGKLVLTCLALAVMCGVARAQLTNLLGNPGFELPDIGKYTNFDAGGPTPYWNDDGVNYTNTGVENTGAHTGTYRAYEMVGDDGAYQISTNPVPLHTGDQVVLTWWALGTTSGDTQGTNATDPMQIVGIITATNDNVIANDPFDQTTTVLVTSNGLPNAWIQYSLTYTATPADAGKYPGCFFNTGEVGTNTANVFAAYDDFTLAVLPAGSRPVILTQPVSQTAPPGANVSFSVSAIDATGYQWQAGTPGSGVYTNLLNAGQFSGVNTPNLAINGVSTNNSMDIIVVVSNGSGSVTSAPPANLTVAGIIYSESFNMPTSADQSVNHVGWMNDVTGPYFNRIFSNNHGVTFPRCAVYSYNGAGATEAFYGTSASITGGPYPASPYPVTNRMAFPGINLAVAQNVSFTVAMNTPGGTPSAFIGVQMNFGPWYVSTNALLPTGGLAFVTNSYKFNPTMSAWNQLTVSGTGSDATTLLPVVGSTATNNLTGYITGIGLVVTRSGGVTLQFDNYSVLGALPFSPLPVISSPPFSTTNYTGTTATFTVAANSNGVSSVLSYQWQTNTAVGSSTWGNLSNGGQYSGVTLPTLSIANISAANHRDYRVIVTDGAGSTTSGPPNGPQATLTLVDASPIPVTAATIYPNNANLFAATVITNEAGNNNTLNFNASFTGTQPIHYQWQVSPNPDGSGAVNVPGANSATYTLANPQVSNTGYYSLQASNSLSGATPTNSAWVQLVTLPSSAATIHWSAPVAINPSPTSALTAAQILSPYGTYFEATGFGAGSIVTVTNGATVFSFDDTTANAVLNSVTRSISAGYTGASTGDTNLDTVIGTDDEIFGGTLTVNNLTPGQLYTVQLFPVNDTAGVSRQGNFSIPTDPADVSASFSFGDNIYVVGTFVATGTTQVFTPGIGGGGGYLAAVIVRTTTTPSPTIVPSGSNLLVSWPIGSLLQATNITGPWITNTATSPLTVTPTAPRLFFRTQIP